MAWFLTLDGASTTLGSVAQSLRDRGLVEGWAGDTGPGLLLAESRSAELSGRLRAAVASGLRVLVACAARSEATEPWSLLREGAEDVVTIAGERGIDHAVARLSRWSEVDRALESTQVRSTAIGDAPAWRQALREVVEIARFTSSPMLVTGETGTGKEVVARLVHVLDPRPDPGELVLVDCTTVVPALSGSEFFGHVKGAFTGATGARAGAFARANGGTLFLDEVGELPLPMQAELLRVVQEGAYKPVGGNEWEFTSFRLVAATNRDLHAAQQRGEFRSDLFFRLAGAHVHLPPLRERREDIVPLFRHFVAGARGGGPEPELDPPVSEFLVRRSYPGNVRDLRQLAARIATRHVGDGPVTPGDIPPADRPASGVDAEAGAAAGGDDLERAIRVALATGIGLVELKAAVAELATQIALEETGGPAAAARMLGVSRRAVEYRKRAQAAPVSSGPPVPSAEPDGADEPQQVAAEHP